MYVVLVLKDITFRSCREVSSKTASPYRAATKGSGYFRIGYRIDTLEIAMI
jgi:hypothetical protein